MHTGSRSKGSPQAADTWTTNPLNPHRIRDSRLADQIELFRQLEEEHAGVEPTLERAFIAARELAEDLQDARIAFCVAAPAGTRIEQELLALERLSPWSGRAEFDAARYDRVLEAEETPLDRARAAYLRALEAAHGAYASKFRDL